MYTIQWIWPVDNLDKGIKSKTRHPLRIVWAKNHKYLGGVIFFLIIFYLFGCTGTYLWHVESSALTRD